LRLPEVLHHRQVAASELVADRHQHHDQRGLRPLAPSTFGNDSEQVADILGNLADLLPEKGNIAEARKLLTEALERDRKRLGNDHVNVAADINNLGRLMLMDANYSQGERLFREAADILRRNHHSTLFITQGNLGELLTRKGGGGGADPGRSALERAARFRGRKPGCSPSPGQVRGLPGDAEEVSGGRGASS
jgi:tetratricopeptide (TPR) repeat protein